MFTHKDIDTRTIFVINCIDHQKSLRVSNGELLLEEVVEAKKKVLTKFPFQKILALFVIGHFTVTTPLMEKCKQHGVALAVVKPTLRPVFFYADSAEANYLLRQRQYAYADSDLTVARFLVGNKVENQIATLHKTRRKDETTLDALAQCQAVRDTLPAVDDYNALMGLEGLASRMFFAAYYQDMEWQGRWPRAKCDPLNVTLDIGYTILFNFVECFARMFGFDLYVGVYHRLWFRRKSLVCDLVEPFRCLIDHAVLTAYNRRQFSPNHFECVKHEWRLKREHCADYYRVFYDELIKHKNEVFRFVQSYYRCFMGRKSVSEYQMFTF